MSAPIGIFEKLEKGEWVECLVYEYFENIDRLNRYRVRLNTRLPDVSDAPEKWWYQGDEGWTKDGRKFTVVLEDGVFSAKFESEQLCSFRDLFEVYKTATHTPPNKKYKRWTGEYDSCYGHPTEKRYIEVEDQRVGEAERRRTGRLNTRAISFNKDNSGDIQYGPYEAFNERIIYPEGGGYLMSIAPIGRRQGPQERRTGRVRDGTAKI